MKRQGRWQWRRKGKSKLNKKIKQAEYRRMLGREKIKVTKSNCIIKEAE